MSVSLVRKALEINTEPSRKSLGKVSKKAKVKSGGGSGSGIRSKKRKLNTKEREEKLVKQNLKLLRVLEPPKSTSFKKQKRQEKEGTSGNSKLEKSAFSEEDFKKFEAEYFVTQ